MDRERIVSLQILRFLAAISVVVAHVPTMVAFITRRPPADWFYQPVRTGAAGVDVFFVLSGFVIAMTGPLAKPMPSGALFFWRRWRRVAPIYFLLSLPPAIIEGFSHGVHADLLAATFLFWPVSGNRLIEPAIVVGWTLCFEMVFYTVVAVFLTGGKLGRNSALGLIVLAAALALRAATGWEPLRFLTSPLFLEFMLGVALANVRGRLTGAPLWAGGALVALGVAAFAPWAAWGVGDLDSFFAIGGFQHDLARTILWGLPAAAIVGGAVVLEPLAIGPMARAAAAGGDASYAIYLTHLAALNLVGVAWLATRLPISYAALTVIGVSAATLGGVIVYRFVERPILRDLKRLGRRPPAIIPAE